MGSMTTMPVSGDWTVDDLDALPDDGLSYELVDGVLLVSPAPSLPHQVGLAALLFQLTAAAPPDLRVLPAPLDIRFSRTRQLQPDIVVLRRSTPPDRTVTTLPLLVVEVLSPSTRAADATLKRHVYEQARIPSFWLLDAETPSLTVLELRDGRYLEVADVQADERFTTTTPFPVTVVPAALVR
jgi:Uma2 family endonuclease